jgi:hypothetical protein
MKRVNLTLNATLEAGDNILLLSIVRDDAQLVTNGPQNFIRRTGTGLFSILGFIRIVDPIVSAGGHVYSIQLTNASLVTINVNWFSLVLTAYPDQCDSSRQRGSGAGTRGTKSKPGARIPGSAGPR